VHTIAAGDSLLSPSVTRRVIDRMAQQPTPELADQAKLGGLTPREREVLGHISRGLSNREIAAALAVEETTIRTHVKRILMKLDLRDRVQAVIFAYETGLNQAARTPPPGVDGISDMDPNVGFLYFATESSTMRLFRRERQGWEAHMG
jgi:DNA-binding CsgD family transcriptional regulator